MGQSIALKLSLSLAAALFSIGLSPFLEGQEQAGELIGRTAPQWDVTHWINSSPLDLRSLQGKVVLLRWWTAPHCSFCAASAPALNELHRAYREKGLVVIGFYHHKSPHPLDPTQVESFTKQFGFQFPVAIDPEWRTLKRWWLDGRERAWTSVSFLIDRQGIIRFIHPGGSYAIGSDDYSILKAKIEELLGEGGESFSALGAEYGGVTGSTRLA